MAALVWGPSLNFPLIGYGPVIRLIMHNIYDLFIIFYSNSILYMINFINWPKHLRSNFSIPIKEMDIYVFWVVQTSNRLATFKELRIFQKLECGMHILNKVLKKGSKKRKKKCLSPWHFQIKWFFAKILNSNHLKSSEYLLKFQPS